jgi:MerR family transcriptional regulator, light-induced transcriptional regulator
VVIAGTHASDDDVARWAYRVRAASGALPMTLYRRGGRAEAARTTARVLPDSAGEAHRLVLDILDGRPRGVAAPAEDPIAQPDDRRQVKAS